MDKRHVILLALVGLIVLGVVISIVAGCLAPGRHSSVLPLSGIEKIDARRMDGGSLSEEGRVAFLRAAVERLLATGGPQ